MPGSRRGLLGREPAEGVRLAALELLEQARAASVRLGDPQDAEALHDFRVALRRLRSWIRSFRPLLDDTLRGRWRRELREVVGATGEARDAEVMQALVQEELRALVPRHRRAAAWLLERVAPAAAAGQDPRAQAAAGFARLAPHLSDGLGRYQRAVGQGRRGRFGDAAAAAVLAQLEVLRTALAEVQGPDDVARAHRARIEGKRLRYLLEPLREAAPAAGEAVRSMRALQDLLGELHDVHVLGARLADAVVEAAAEGARAMHQALQTAGEDQARAVGLRSHRPGLLALDRRIRARRDALHAALAEGWLRGGEGADRLGREVEAVLAALGRARRRRRARPQAPRTRRR
jgi:CHAD domain-containing protein